MSEEKEKSEDESSEDLARMLAIEFEDNGKVPKITMNEDRDFVIELKDEYVVIPYEKLEVPIDDCSSVHKGLSRIFTDRE